MNPDYYSKFPEPFSICNDAVFKAVFTKNTTESRTALRSLLSAFLERKLSIVDVSANEPAINDIRDRQIRFDISVIFNDGELANVEMTLNPKKYEGLRFEYYTARLFVDQDIRGKDKSYSDLKHSYQIALLVNAPIYEDYVFVHNFKYYDEENGISLNGRSHIITIELSKLEQIALKPVTEMNSLERWAIFFRYTPDKEKRELINEIIKSKEGSAMGAQVLLSISKDENERARLTSEYKFAVDLQSKTIDARRAGVLEGVKQVAQNMLKRNRPINDIIEDTGLTREEIEDLHL